MKPILYNLYKPMKTIIIILLLLLPLFIAFLAQIFINIYHRFNQDTLFFSFYESLYKYEVVRNFVQNADIHLALDISIVLYLIAIVLFFFLYRKRNFIKPTEKIFQNSSDKKTFSKSQKIKIGLFLLGACIATLVLFYIIGITNSRNFWYILIWFVSIALSIIAIIKIDTKLPDISLLKMNKREIFFILMAMVCLYALSLYKVNLIQPLLTGDEISSANAALELYRNPHLIWDTSNFCRRPYFGFILPALFYNITGINLLAIRLGSAILALISIPAFYLLARNMFSRSVAMVSTIIFCTYPAFVFYAKIGLGVTHVTTAYIFAMLFLVLALKQNNNLYLFLSGFVAAFGFYTWGAGIFIFTLTSIFFVYLLILFSSRWKKIIFKYLIYIFGFILFLSPLMARSFSESDGKLFLLDTAASPREVLSSQQLDSWKQQYHTNSYVKIFIENINGVIYKNFIEADMHNQAGLPSVNAILLMLGLVMIFSNYKNVYFVLIVLSFLLLNFFGGVLTGYFTIKRMLVYTPALSVICAIPIIYIALAIRNTIKSEALSKIIYDKLLLLFAILLVSAGALKFHLDSHQIELIQKDKSDIMPALVNSLAKVNVDVYLLNFESHEAIEHFPALDCLYPLRLHIDEERVFIHSQNNQVFYATIMNTDLPIKASTNNDIMLVVNNSYGTFLINRLLSVYPGGNLYVIAKKEPNKIMNYLYFVRKDTVNRALTLDSNQKAQPSEISGDS
jgi:4-amino-4-deoxy-L-arabinose transferase-like glycosyltransferase